MKQVLKNAWFLMYPLILYLVITFAVSIIMSTGFLTVYTLKITALSQTYDAAAAQAYLNENMMLINLVTQLVVLPAMILIYYFDRKKKRVERESAYQRVSVLKYLCILPVAVGLCCGLNRIISLLPDSLSADYSELSESMYSADMWMQVLSIVVAAGVLEEILFRGILYRRLKAVMPHGGYAAVVSAAVFGVIHGNLVQFLYAFCLGLVLVYVYEKYKSIAAPMLFHMTANAMSVFMSSRTGQTYLLPLWEMGPAYFFVMVVELIIAGLMLKVIDNEVNPVKKIYNEMETGV